MAVFRLLSALIRLPLALIFIPLRFLGVPLAVLMVPVRLIMHNFVLVFIVVASILLYRVYMSGDSTPTTPTLLQPSAPSPREVNPARKPGQIDPVRRREDGDSAFATDLYASMNDAERQYYSQMFFAVMSGVESGTPYPWQAVNIAGTITPTDRFRNSRGATCRHFTEVLKVHSIEQTLTGTACERVEGGWCKLKPNATPACGLSSGKRGGILDAIKGLF